MRVTFATQSARPDRPNEDFVIASPDAAVLLDGAGTPPGAESGCAHGVAWYARTLGSTLINTLTQSGGTLPEILAEGIKATTSLHAFSCDVTHPGSPSATVIMLRRSGETLEYLVLADSVLVLDVNSSSDPVVITDGREGEIGARYRADMDAFDSGSENHAVALRAYVETLQAHRNRDGGFWVAAAEPLAADHALTGTVPAGPVRAAALLSDGASRLADRFGLLTWGDLLDVLDREGPAGLIERTRQAEESDPNGRRWPRGKAFDDASAIYCRI